MPICSAVAFIHETGRARCTAVPALANSSRKADEPDHQSPSNSPPDPVCHTLSSHHWSMARIDSLSRHLLFLPRHGFQLLVLCGQSRDPGWTWQQSCFQLAGCAHQLIGESLHCSSRVAQKSSRLRCGDRIVDAGNCPGRRAETEEATFGGPTSLTEASTIDSFNSDTT